MISPLHVLYAPPPVMSVQIYPKRGCAQYELVKNRLDSSTRGAAGTYKEQTEQIIVLPGLANLAPRVDVLRLITGDTALFTALIMISPSDEFRDDSPSTAVNNKNIDAVRRMIETNRRVTFHEIRASLGMGMSQIQSIVHKHLAVKKLCSWWTSRGLTKAQKTDRVTWCSSMLTRFKKGA
ncbi:hypothetical protein EVAR_18477_1 [Eumeta japonica]|uniref:Uncharacterized protein n=1 Tax=Eumeta variegata TaxID=151549 RepID=A0A4C1UZM6_EUMVA|nr:hypothetical protein EVAR_18477_1 [Eumeta japonica]